MILTIIQSNISSPPSERFLSAQPTEGVHAVVKVYVYDWFAEFDRALDKSASVVRRPIAVGKTSAVEELRVAQLEDIVESF